MESDCGSQLDDPSFAPAGLAEDLGGLADGALSVHSAVGTRGLFLLAYQVCLHEIFCIALMCLTQGVGLLRNRTDDDTFLDKTLPQLYFDLLESMNSNAKPKLLLDSSWQRHDRAVSEKKIEIRVGFVSSFFSDHSVGRLLAGPLEGFTLSGHRCSTNRGETEAAGSCLHITLVHVR